MHTDRLLPILLAALLLPPLAAADAQLSSAVDIDAYDATLCSTAQRLIVNADAGLQVIEQKASGNGFHTIQMAIDPEQDAAVIAMTTDYTEVDGAQQASYVSCKMVNRKRVNASLNRQLPGPDRQCRVVNEHTYATALARLAPAAREHYQRAGRKLRFADDAIVPTGGEWLPVTLDNYVQTDEDGNVTVASPSVRVPWDPVERNFYQGTQHCKLISLAAMNRWVNTTAFTASAPLIPRTDMACTAPHSMTSAAGSCRFYFAPADAMFCQDYSGSEWTRETAQQECAGRHASPAALKAAANRYAGDGGIYSEAACATRPDTTAIAGTCVFNCRADDESLWHITGDIDPRMTRGCDLFVSGE